MTPSANSSRFDISALSDPRKPIVREALRSIGLDVRDTDFTVNVKLQKGGGVSGLFEEALLKHPKVNFFEPKLESMVGLCRRWAKLTELARDKFAEIASQKKPVVRTIGQSASLFRRMAELRQASERSRYTVISMFAGGGGSSLGHLAAGGKVVLANEFVPEAAETYRRNFTGTFVDTRDIRELLKDEAGLLALLRGLDVDVRNIDVLDGSPPCSEFSVAGRGIADPTIMKNYSDTKQRDISGLPIDFALFALLIRPRVVVMENVPSLVTRGKAILAAIASVLGEQYFVSWVVLNANDFGVAQARRRLFFIAVRKDVGSVIGINSNFDVHRAFPNRTFMHETIRTAFADLDQTADDVRPWIYSARQTGLERAIVTLPKNPNRLTRPVQFDGEKRRNFTLTRCSWDLPAPTLTVTAQQPSGLAGAIHPDQDRKFTIPELKRLTGLPDDFQLSGTVAQAAERICRMVPPPMTQAIAESVYERVLEPYRKAIHEEG
ncbi:DNA cytosine methyltransferase [Afipia felis]|uniref:Cytosine-specific methyltransferase n=2 Tax=Afipia felis TaxID=1035 RepID=A0A380WCI5_AFIFE|nr:DNA cytosine methyltransferase [Afipia felis]EKS29879.1 DNA (cytosine-5-)-methyltransferase [Afipia felis ATCC 53690]SUU78586.1 Modification methylase HaeIII [Afipia felis]SUU86651.1 Modification methylase HaeIII [Afipia felis]